jgi:hypothetical protein
MPLSDLINRPCLIYRRAVVPGEEDDYGNDVVDETFQQTVFELQQADADEQPGTGQRTRTRWDAFFLDGTDLQTDDAVFDLLEEELYEVEGRPARWRNPRTKLFEHVEATLIRVGGAEDSS